MAARRTGRKFSVKWKMNILVTFWINFATREAERHSVFQVWNVRNICQQSQRTCACRTSRHKLAHCNGLATSGNRKSCWLINVCARVCIKHCCKAWLQELLSAWIIVHQQSPPVRRGAHAHDPISRIKSSKHESTGQRSYCWQQNKFMNIF